MCLLSFPSCVTRYRSCHGYCPIKHATLAFAHYIRYTDPQLPQGEADPARPATSCAPLRLRLKIKLSTATADCHSGMSQRILTQPVRLLTPRIYQRTTSVFPQKFQSSKPTTPLQTRTMSDIKQISSQRAAQRKYFGLSRHMCCITAR